MVRIIFLLFFTSIFFISCADVNYKDISQKSKSEILQVEKEFEQMVKDRGVAEGFYFYADENASIRTKDSLITGRDAIKNYYSSRPYKDVKLEWTADFADASKSGELGYTYGKYTFSAVDSNGKKIESKGYFHTVWKKQKDGNWKFVWD